MKGNIYYAFVFNFVFLTISCSYSFDNLISDSIQELPEWIQLVEDDLNTQDAIYVKLNQSALWEPGDDVIKLEKQIEESLQIIINGIALPPENVILLDVFSPPVIVYEETAKSLGSHGEFIHIYFTPIVTSGMNTATIQVTTTSGIIYSYTWEFDFDSDP